jgi:hypothetical protein
VSLREPATGTRGGCNRTRRTKSWPLRKRIRHRSGSGGFSVFLREGVRASSDRYIGGGKSTTADRQIGYRARAFPHAVIDLDEIRRSRHRSPL